MSNFLEGGLGSDSAILVGSNHFVLSGATNGTAPMELLPASGAKILLEDNSAIVFYGVLMGYSTTGQASGWQIQGVIKRGVGAASTAIVDEPSINTCGIDVGSEGWVGVTFEADTTNGGLSVIVEGEDGVQINWRLNVFTTKFP